MIEKVELFGGALRFTPLWLFLDLVFLLHFAISWIYSYKKTKWKIDFFHFSLLQYFVVPLLLSYPFNASFYNLPTIGMNPFLQADSYIDRAFAITALGYTGVWLGSYLISLVELRQILERLFALFRPFENCITQNIRSRRSIYFLLFVCIALTLLITTLSTLNGFFLRPRAFFQQNGTLRPLYNFTITLAPILLTFISLYFIQQKEKWAKILLIVALPFTILYGIRAVLIESLLFYYIFYLFKNRGQFKIIRFLTIVFCLVFLGLELEKIREGLPILNASYEFIVPLIYGNFFSDTRDFAWVLANSEGDYLYGLGYLANLLSFIPSSFLEFRQHYSLTNYTSNLIGLDLAFHNGVRSGFFGQVFFNFSFIGVFVSGIVFGMVLKYTDQNFKKCILEKNDIIEAYGKTIPFLCILSFIFSSNYWIFYLFILIHLMLSMVRRVRKGCIA